MSTPQPQRRVQRRTHLDASVVPVERALLARATALDAKSGVSDHETVNWIAVEMAAEFRALAEELHWH